MIANFVNLADNKFTLNGIEYHKNYAPIQVNQSDSQVRVISAYDSRFQLVPPTHYSDYTVNGVTYNSVESLIHALVDVVFSKFTLDGVAKEFQDSVLQYVDDLQADISGFKGDVNNDLQQITAEKQVFESEAQEIKDALANMTTTGKIYDSLADAIAESPKPADGTPFSVMGDGDNDGYYKFDSTQPDGVKFGRKFDRRIQVESISQLRQYKGRPGEAVDLLGYYESGDGGGGTFFWDAVSTEMDNSSTIIKPNDGLSSGRWKRSVSDIISVKWFGAKGDGVTDDSNAIQAFFDYGMGAFPRIPVLFFPPGNYSISKKIFLNDFYGGQVRGAGGQYGTTIKVSSDVPESSPIDAIFQVGDGFCSYGNFSEINFDGNNRAVRILDFTNNGTREFGIRYSKFKNLSISNIRSDGFGIDGLSWTNIVDGCDIYGYGSAPEPGRWEGIGIGIYASNNGVQITNSTNFRRLTHGVYYGRQGQCVNIDNCVFDNIKSAAIVSLYGAKVLNIEKNYFEGCGGTPVQVESFDGSSHSVNAVILLAQNPTTPHHVIRSVGIKGNYFIQCNSDHIIGLNTAYNVSINQNQIDEKSGGGKYLSFVHLFGYGATYADTWINGKTLKIEDNNYNVFSPGGGNVPSVEKILSWSDLILDSWGLDNIIVRDTIYRLKMLPGNLVKRNIVNEHLGEYTAELYDQNNGNPIYKLTHDGSSRAPIHLTQDLEKYRGKYLRIHYGAINNSSNIRLRLDIADGTKIESFENKRNGDINTLSFDYVNALFYVDEAATKLTYEFHTYGGEGTVHYLKDFQIIDAGYDVTFYEEIPLRYFDATGKPIWYNGTDWVDATGTTV